MPMNYSEMERELRNLREKTTIYEEILKETHRSEDRAKQSENRLLSTVHWTLGTAITVTLLAIFAVVGLNWWINEKVYTRDKQALHDEFTKMVKEGIDTQSRNQITTIQTQFTNLKSELLKEQNSSYANAFIQLADIRQSLLDLEGALINAIVAFHKATDSGSKDWIAALERMNTAIRRATMGQKRLPDILIWEVQKILTNVERMSPQGNDQASKLKESLKAHEAKPSP